MQDSFLSTALNISHLTISYKTNYHVCDLADILDLDDFSGMKKKKKKKKKPYDMEGLEDALPVCDCVTDLADVIISLQTWLMQ